MTMIARALPAWRPASALIAALASPAAFADIDLSEYESKTALKDKKSQRQNGRSATPFPGASNDGLWPPPPTAVWLESSRPTRRFHRCHEPFLIAHRRAV